MTILKFKPAAVKAVCSFCYADAGNHFFGCLKTNKSSTVYDNINNIKSIKNKLGDKP